jgi:hypothetical protein
MPRLFIIADRLMWQHVDTLSNDGLPLPLLAPYCFFHLQDERTGPPGQYCPLSVRLPGYLWFVGTQISARPDDIFPLRPASFFWPKANLNALYIAHAHLNLLSFSMWQALSKPSRREH